jgi:endonuclease G
MIRIFFAAISVFAAASLQAQPIARSLEQVQQAIADHEQALARLSAKADSLRLAHIREQLSAMGWPSNDEVIMHSALALAYDESHEVAKWVAHIILPEVKDGRTTRTNDFRVDPKVKTGTAEEGDYFIKKKGPDGKTMFDGFGFDRGHLAPSADFRWNQNALSESYYYSNMTPQRPEFNRESWAAIEDLVREYAIRHQVPLYVVTGPVLHDALPKIERSINKVSIPEYHYKVAIDLVNGQSIGILMPNKRCEKPVEAYVKSIAEIEALTGLNFFPSLSAEQEQLLERDARPEPWVGKAGETAVRILRNDELEKGQYNTLQAYEHANTGKKITVCGTVVSTFKSKKNNVFVNLDRRFPNTVFTVTIWNSNIQNFSYNPDKDLMDTRICVRGEVTLRDGIAQMNATSEKQVIFIDDL